MIGLPPFGRLTVTAFAGLSAGKSQARWDCLCECGNTLLNVSGTELRRGHIRSCGCYKVDSLTTHGMTNTRIFSIWSGMRARCRKPKGHDIKTYKGVSVCDRWLTFENFYADVGNPPSSKHSIDRWPNKVGDYEPGNWRWATSKEQARNTRANNLITINNETHTLTEWSEISGVHRSVIKYRQDHGRTPEELISKTRTKWRQTP